MRIKDLAISITHTYTHTHTNVHTYTLSHTIQVGGRTECDSLHDIPTNSSSSCYDFRTRPESWPKPTIFRRARRVLLARRGEISVRSEIRNQHLASPDRCKSSANNTVGRVYNPELPPSGAGHRGWSRCRRGGMSDPDLQDADDDPELVYYIQNKPVSI